MTAMRKIVLLSVLFALFASAAATAQNSLFDNPKYRRSLDLQRMSKSSYDSGDYLKAAEYAQEAELLANAARDEAETQFLMWVANSWKNRAATRVAFGERVNAAERYPAVWPEAQAAFALAKSEYDAAAYEASIRESKRVVELLSGLAEPSRRPVAAQPPESAPAAPALPAFYTVRLIEAARDCFWRIAEYPFVYGDPRQWRILYEANKDKMPVPENPDLILPGMVLSIPSVGGETRSGTWPE